MYHQAFALNACGHRRATVDVDLVMREDRLQALSESTWSGLRTGPGTGKLLDTS
jgi:hypothetical protein